MFPGERVSSRGSKIALSCRGVLVEPGVIASGAHCNVLRPLLVLIVASLGAAATPAQAWATRTVSGPGLVVGNASGDPGDTVSVNVTLQAPGATPGVAAAQNDLTYDSSRIAVVECTVNPLILKETTSFGFLPGGCTGAACTGLRILVLSLLDPNGLIPDGAVLYSCQVSIAADAPAGDYPLTVSNLLLNYPDPPGGAVCGVPGLPCEAVSGVVTVSGNTPRTPTPTSPPTNTPVVTPTQIQTPTATGTSPVSGPGIGLGSAIGNPGDTVSVSATLQAPGVTPGVTGAQNDFTYDSSKIAVMGHGGAIGVGRPDCSANPMISKEATQFSFLPRGCTGVTCTGVRVLVFSLDEPNQLIPDGSVLYSCQVRIAADAPLGQYVLALSNTVLSLPSPPGGQACSSTSNPPCTLVDGAVTVSILPTRTATPTPTPSPTCTPTFTATSIPSATATTTLTPIPCVGDCSGDRHVGIDAILIMVNIALGNAKVDICSVADANQDGQVTVDEIVTAVNNALNGCGSI